MTLLIIQAHLQSHIMVSALGVDLRGFTRWLGVGVENLGFGVWVLGMYVNEASWSFSFTHQVDRKRLHGTGT